jgi:hypothetical protein
MTNKLPVIGKRYKHKSYPGQECLIINITEHRVVYEEVVTRGNVKNGINSYKKSVVWNFLEELPDQELIIIKENLAAYNASLPTQEEAVKGLRNLFSGAPDQEPVEEPVEEPDMDHGEPTPTFIMSPPTTSLILDYATVDPKPVVKKSFTTEKVKEAIDNAKYHLGINQYHDHGAALVEIKEATQNLVDAIEEQKEEKVSDSTPLKKPNIKQPRGYAQDIEVSNPPRLITDGDKPSSEPSKEEPKSIWKPISELKEGLKSMSPFSNDTMTLSTFINCLENLEERITKLENK